MGEKQNQPFQLSFNPCLKVDFQGSRVTSDSGLLLVRELDERLGLSALIAENIMEDRRGKNTQLPLPDLLRQSIYSRLAGYEDLNDAERLSQDPTFRLIGSEKIWDRGAALPSRLHWFETEVLSQDENLDGLSRINRELLAKAEAIDSPQRVVLDMDSTEIPVYGEQEQSAYNGGFPRSTGQLISDYLDKGIPHPHPTDASPGSLEVTDAPQRGVTSPDQLAMLSTAPLDGNRLPEVGLANLLFAVRGDLLEQQR